MIWQLVPRLELNWMIIIPHKTWEAEKTLCQGNICVLNSKSSPLLIWIFNIEAQGCETVFVYWYVCQQWNMHKDWTASIMTLLFIT